ncbi:MAG: acyltransferase [Solobacterium sp.]|nr:acyltransferase [Solobacterium sp.]
MTVFFVLSGFLVTRNLLKEAEQKKTIDFTGFWKKRILRLIPALVFVIAVTVILFAVFNRVLFTKECGVILSAVTGWNNWHQIFSNVSYFENAGAPSPLTHTWSLSIEMQFYLIISVLFLLISRSEKRKNLLTGISAAGIIVSTLLMFILFDPTKDPTRVYYGTDTRIFSLLAGSLLAVYEKELRGFFDHPLISLSAGIVSLAALLAMMVFISGYSSFMFRGGQIIATLLACVVTVSLFKENTIFSKVLSVQPLKWIGDHSYAIYLWHYPLMLMMTNGQKAKLSDVLLVSGLTVFFTLISDLFVETPFAAGTIGRMIRILRSTPKTKKAQKRQLAVRRVFIPAACVEGLLVVCAAFALLLCRVKKRGPIWRNLKNRQKRQPRKPMRKSRRGKKRQPQARIRQRRLSPPQAKSPRPLRKPMRRSSMRSTFF